MFYTIQITVEPDNYKPARLHEPCNLRTLTDKKEDITDEEIEMVADAFKRQVKHLLQEMIKT